MEPKRRPSLRPISPVRVHASGASDIGRVYDHNDDTTLVRPDLHLYLAADGVGGHKSGHVASSLAAKHIAEFIEMTASVATSRPETDALGLHRDARRLATAIQFANRKILKAAEQPDCKGMGTTVVAVLLSPDSGVMNLAHVGDSRCYRLREGRMELLTFDHSLLHDVLELRPDMDDAALAGLPANVLTRALGMEDGVRVSVRTLELAPGDRYVLCSDGLTDAITPEEIAEILALPNSPESIVSAFIAAANDAGGPDNISAVVIVCDPAERAKPVSQKLPLPRPRRKRSAPAPAPQIAMDEGESDEPDLELGGDEDEPEEAAPDLEWDEPGSGGSRGSGWVTEVVDELLAADSRMGAVIDRASGRTTNDGDEVNRCVKCTAALEPDVNFCGFCGAPQHRSA